MCTLCKTAWSPGSWGGAAGGAWGIFSSSVVACGNGHMANLHEWRSGLLCGDGATTGSLPAHVEAGSRAERRRTRFLLPSQQRGKQPPQTLSDNTAECNYSVRLYTDTRSLVGPGQLHSFKTQDGKVRTRLTLPRTGQYSWPLLLWLVGVRALGEDGTESHFLIQSSVKILGRNSSQNVKNV